MNKEKLSILIADDKPAVLKNVKEVLSRSKDIKYKLEAVRSGEDTLKKAAGNHYDLVILNENLPDKSGISMLQELYKRKLGIPVIMIVAEGREKVGVKAMDKGAYDFLTHEEVRTVALSRAIRRVMHRIKLENDIRESLRKMEKLAIRDGLTGLFNHRHFKDVIKKEFKKSKRYGQPMSCIMIDLDYFKAVNDNFGHQFGDHVLVNAAKILKKLVRDTDFVARYGGEEFFIILPNTELKGAYILAERIRSAFASNVFRKGTVSRTVTVSIGVSSSSDVNVINDDDLIENADKALYKAKESGRNRVCTLEEKELDESLGITEDRKKVEDFSRKLSALNDSIREHCIESAHRILTEIQTDWEHISRHSERVSDYAEKICRKLSLSDDDVNVIKRAALLHDIGMVGVNSRLLNKKGRLTKKEYEMVKKHANIGVKLIEKTRLFEKELPIILYHHERYDGSGYPHRLKAEEIPVGSRILAVAEAYERMISDKPYRKALSSDDAIVELKECAGTHFDPHIVNAFVKVIGKKSRARRTSSNK
jgi:diguanylate cyclase (GGDEF)-like protein/putative nucleotidyltransferase with HDIG domain